MRGHGRSGYTQGTFQYLLANRYDVEGAADLSQCAFESFADSTQKRTLQIQTERGETEAQLPI